MNRDLTGKPPMSQADKLCLVALAGILVATTLVYEMTDGKTARAAAESVDKLSALTIAAPPINDTPLAETMEAIQADHYDEAIPLDRELQAVLWEACEANGVPVCLALGLIETESGFQPDVVSSQGCYGLFQLNPRWFPADLDPAGNIRSGVDYLGMLLERHEGDTAAALRAYNRGFDDGDRAYARRVLEAAEKWGGG